ncbi:hypothetical protein [Acetanaerobacterium elongatum]|uniref:Uncharacterized protein n=1 Tax=Acetanaerobacterium elongatum TaxID=258515 RepID=A0A1H0BN72_9FIRM|nr:hypothetical protein [Acetanaerobacterium elongatum]SDN47032.1 hypothetical protein SAMN05192585_12011 [Acetanaerobacterium elongatum]
MANEVENENVVEPTNDEMVSMSKTDFNKAIQSAEDRLRTKYSKEIKELEQKITNLTPANKSEQEIELETRLAEVAAKEKRLNLQDTLLAKNLDKSFVDYLRDDADVDAFEKIITNIISQRIIETGYTPINHNNTDSITKEKWHSMSFSERQKVFESNPELAKRLMKSK